MIADCRLLDRKSSSSSLSSSSSIFIVCGATRRGMLPEQKMQLATDTGQAGARVSSPAARCSTVTGY
jgi:hypothetical protein